MAYTTNLPPTVARTAHSTYELRDSTGFVIQTYDQVAMDHPADWWEDFLAYVANNVSGQGATLDAVTDVTLLMMQTDWQVVDER